MAKVKQPLFSLGAVRKLGDDIVFKRQGRTAIVETRPIPADARSPGQLSWRHMFQKVVALWHALSAAEKEAWESLARSRHMTGYAWFVSQALRPNPGIYLPLQGGVMQGIIDMDGYAIQDLLDPVNPQDADTEAARDAAIAAALEDCIDSHIHGWDGENWQKLLVESAGQRNLRTRLYDGASPVLSTLWNVDTHSSSTRGLCVSARLLSAGRVPLEAIPTNIDNLGVATTARWLGVAAVLFGFDGSTFDRLRTYGTGILKTGRAPIGLSTLVRTATGQVKAAAGSLYWMTMNPDAAASIIELSDDLDGSSARVWRMLHGQNAAHHMNLDPPIEFSTGIYLKTLVNVDSITFGYK